MTTLLPTTLPPVNLPHDGQIVLYSVIPDDRTRRHCVAALVNAIWFNGTITRDEVRGFIRCYAKDEIGDAAINDVVAFVKSI